MELRNIRHFVAVAQDLSFTKAAERIYISQQALSKSINYLEKELGFPLFDRSGRNLKLTPYGSLFLKRSYSIIANVNEAVSELKNLNASINSSVRIGCTTGTEYGFPVSNYINFQHTHQDYKITTFCGSDRVIENMLVSGQLDVGIMGALGHNPELEFYPMIKNETVVFVNKNNPLAKKEKITLRDLKDETFLFSSSDYYCNSMLIAACNIAGFIPNISHSTPSFEFQLNLAKDNQGIFFVPDHTVPLIHEPDLVPLRFYEDPYIFFMHMAIKKEDMQSPAVTAFKEYIFKVLQ